MNPGLFKHRITFQKYDPNSVDDEGFPLPEEQRYSVVKSVWAMIKTLRGTEYQQANTTKAETTSRFVIRYSAGKGITSDMRLVYKGRPFEIDAIINDDELNITFTILAKEVM